ncbi:MAG: pyridoxamine 5'-phosphate oxidase family protein [Proteobacteria bacterium]|jgi:hypothetical protein|nr:pyridoxamine 5'-phosphate oxidase family protein [Pseudomonadota bacterium]MDA1301711.1 pyridoxamine 5'-phosphate oxidase family protein [Pseudomonadota bacterium]
MTTTAWQRLVQQAPDLAAFGKDRLDGKVAYLATIRPDGKPRTHPVTPVIGHGNCFVFVEPDSQKVRDLQSNGAFCLHCAVNDSSGSSGEFQVIGEAVQENDPEMRLLAESVSSYRPSARSILFKLEPQEVLATSYRGGRADRSRWMASC